ncbi:hypothetical protein KY334_02560 [Candidatus Woesearchaeota archaeon]|nr:hypothetical protein [Candidatus Woesearchaeota archaeon]
MSTEYYVVVPNEEYKESHISAKWTAPFKLVLLGENFKSGFVFSSDIFLNKTMTRSEWKYLIQKNNLMIVDEYYNEIQMEKILEIISH